MGQLRGERPFGQQCMEEADLAQGPESSGKPGELPGKHETAIVFDWDDTILPTSWLERIHALSGGGVVPTLRPEAQRMIAALCTDCATTLELAGRLGTVVIITNSAPGWVMQSCQLFMPQLLNQVRNYPVYAKPMHVSPFTFKNTAFARECKQFR